MYSGLLMLLFPTFQIAETHDLVLVFSAFFVTSIFNPCFWAGIAPFSITIGSSYQTNGSSNTSKICWSIIGAFFF